MKRQIDWHSSFIRMIQKLTVILSSHSFGEICLFSSGIYTLSLNKHTHTHIYIYICMCGGGGLVTKLCQTLAILWTIAQQVPLSVGFPGKNMQWVAISFPGESSWCRDWTQVSCFVNRLFTPEPPLKPCICIYINMCVSGYVCMCVYIYIYNVCR